jgi:hypothetical protein
MGLWMLSFRDHGAAIIEAESMAHARLRAAVKVHQLLLAVKNHT